MSDLLPSYQMVHAPYPHQLERFEIARDFKVDALFWEQGTGKTKSALDKAAWLRLTQKINGVVVLATNGVHFNWVKDEIPTHMPPNITWKAFGWSSDRANTKSHDQRWRQVLEAPKTLSFLCMGYDAVTTEKGKKAVAEMLRRRKCMMICDESARIKTPKAKRVRTIIPLGRKAEYRQIMTGTPIAQGPFDVYSQIRFLDEGFWKREFGLQTFTEFKQYFGVFRTDTTYEGQEYDVLVEYRRMDQLENVLKKISSRVTKDVLGLPPKIYQMRYFEMTPKQKRIYEQLRDEAMAVVDQFNETDPDEYEKIIENLSDVEDLNSVDVSIGNTITAPLPIVQLLRMQQVLCGYVKNDNGEIIDICEDDNPRMKVLFEEIETAIENNERMIIWSRFTRDIDKIMERLQRYHNRVKAVRYDGKCNDEQKEDARFQFQKGDANFFVANPAAAGEGLTLTSSTRSVYYSNSFKLIERLQSEDRNHRIGQKYSVTYTDICCAETIDEKVIRALRAKLNIASLILGDKFREWVI